MKKILSIILSLCLLITLCSCNKKETVLIYSCSEEIVNSNLKSELSKQFPDYDIIIQYLGTGETYSRLLSEKSNTSADIVFDLEACYAQQLVDTVDCFENLTDYDFSDFEQNIVSYTANHKKFVPESKTNIVIAYSKSQLDKYDLDIPIHYSDLLSDKYKGHIAISSPKTSGTGYAFYNTFFSNYGLDYTIDYFSKLIDNVDIITSSGSAPLKMIDKQETAIGFSMLWQTVIYANDNQDIGFTFLDMPTGYNVYTFACIKNKLSRKAVKDVFDYMFYVWNKQHCEMFYPDKIYSSQVSSIPNYPTNILETNMVGLYDFSHKQMLLSNWNF